jgi:hypothetical protein
MVFLVNVAMAGVLAARKPLRTAKEVRDKVKILSHDPDKHDQVEAL